MEYYRPEGRSQSNSFVNENTITPGNIQNSFSSQQHHSQRVIDRTNDAHLLPPTRYHSTVQSGYHPAHSMYGEYKGVRNRRTSPMYYCDMNGVKTTPNKTIYDKKKDKIKRKQNKALREASREEFNATWVDSKGDFCPLKDTVTPCPYHNDKFKKHVVCFEGDCNGARVAFDTSGKLTRHLRTCHEEWCDAKCQSNPSPSVNDRNNVTTPGNRATTTPRGLFNNTNTMSSLNQRNNMPPMTQQRIYNDRNRAFNQNQNTANNTENNTSLSHIDNGGNSESNINIRINANNVQNTQENNESHIKDTETVDIEMDSYDSNEESPTGNNYLIWKYLIESEQNLWEERKNIVTDRINLLLSYQTGALIKMPGDGNCLPHALSYHINGVVSDIKCTEERSLIVEYTKSHKSDFPSIDPDKFTGSVSMEGEHITAWHLARSINIVVYEYDELKDSFIQHTWFDQDNVNKSACYLLFTRFGEYAHYDYIQCSLSLNEEPEQAHFYPETGDKCEPLMNFDLQNNINQMVEIFKSSNQNMIGNRSLV